jgi:class 3 adenylate cyclase
LVLKALLSGLSSRVGETPNLAARLQSLAQPGTIVIADSTKKLIGDLFECRDMGTVTVKGYEDPVRAWQILALSKIESVSRRSGRMS